jgi:hypothetical protein
MFDVGYRMLDVGCWMHVVTSDFGQMGTLFPRQRSSFLTSQQQRTKQQAFSELEKSDNNIIK